MIHYFIASIHHWISASRSPAPVTLAFSMRYDYYIDTF